MNESPTPTPRTDALHSIVKDCFSDFSSVTMRVQGAIRMMVMPADACGFNMGWLAQEHKGRFGWLLNATCWRQDPDHRMPYGIDNGKFGAWAKKREWDEAMFYSKLKYLRMLQHKPLWVVVPDSVGNRQETLEQWAIHAPRTTHRRDGL